MSVKRSPSSSQANSGRSKRDPRLDFFRGIAMLIIFMAHVPANLWGQYIPARYGWSDATEMFVFCSGFTAALAFGGTFYKASFLYGTARIFYRIWQIYAAHIAMFIFIGTLVFGATFYFGDVRNYVGQLNLTWFFNNPGEGLLGLFTLGYVPNYFDILPMYMGALLMVPIVMALSRLHAYAAIGFVLAVYIATHVYGLNFSSHPEYDLVWFFNPLGWQLLFFTGFAFAMKWIPAPKISRPWVIVAVIWVAFSVAASRWSIAQDYELLREFRALIWDPDGRWDIRGKTDFGVIRYLHFLALAYIALAIVNGRLHMLHQSWAKPIITVGQNSLPIFLLSMGLARVAGMVLDQIGRTELTFALVNLGGLAIIVGFAYWCTLLKKQPWRQMAASYDTNAYASRVEQSRQSRSASQTAQAQPAE